MLMIFVLLMIKGSNADENSSVSENKTETQSSDQKAQTEQPEPTRKVIEEVPAKQESDYSPSLVKVQLRWGGYVVLEVIKSKFKQLKGFLMKEQLIKKKIKLNIKTFYGSRKKITIEVDINATVESIRNLLLSHHLENEKTLYNLRLIYPMVNSIGTKRFSSLFYYKHRRVQYRN